MSYKKFADDLINGMYEMSDINFKEYSTSVGSKIYKVGGIKGLYKVMDILYEELSSEYSESDNLLVIESSWNDVCIEWKV